MNIDATIVANYQLTIRTPQTGLLGLSRLKQLQVGYPNRRRRVDFGDGFGDRERLDQGEMSHSARRSRISLTPSVEARSISMNSASC